MTVKKSPNIGWLGDLIDPDWSWLWSRRTFIIKWGPDNQPLAYVNGIYQDIVVADSTPGVTAGEGGYRGDFRETSGHGATAYHVLDANLPDWFPGKSGGTQTPFTMLCALQIDQIPTGKNDIVLQKAPETENPIFLFARDTNFRASLRTGATTLQGSSGVIPRTLQLVGCRWDGTDQSLIINEKIDISNAIADITQSTGPLNIATRRQSVDVAAQRLDGEINIIVFIDLPLDQAQLQQFQPDPSAFLKSFRPPTFELLEFNIAGDTGLYTYTGFNAGLIVARTVPIDTGVYAYTGFDAGLNRIFKIEVDTGLYSFIGNDIAFSQSETMETGLYTFMGSEVTLTASASIWTIQSETTATWTVQDNEDDSTWIIQ